MSHLPLSVALTLSLLASACDSKQSTDTAAAPAQPPVAAATPAASDPAPTTPATPTATTPADPASSDAGPAAAPGDGASVDIATLAGKYTFGWGGGKKAKCQKVDEKMMKKLTAGKAKCRRRDPGEGFSEGAGDWSSCEVGKSELVVFATKAICQDQLETMEANAP